MNYPNYFIDLEFTSDPPADLKYPIIFEQLFEKGPDVISPITKKPCQSQIAWKVNGNQMYRVGAAELGDLQFYLREYCGGDEAQAMELWEIICVGQDVQQGEKV